MLTKVLEWGRLMSYLEQSTRYIPYDSRLSTGHYRYWRDPDVLDSSLGARYVGDMDRMFDTYAELLPLLQAHLVRAFPNDGTVSDFAYRQSVRARALDALRGLLPAAALSNVGIYGSGQSYEQLLLRMRGHPLPEVRAYAELILEELRKVIPSFLSRLDRPERGGEWSRVPRGPARRDGRPRQAPLRGPDRSEGDATSAGASVTLADFDPEGEEKVLVAMCYPHSSLAESELASRIRRLGAEERAADPRAPTSATRKNRRHRPGRALERTGYRFDIVSDYGAFRDLQRHRMLTIEWQPLVDEPRLRGARGGRRGGARRGLRRTRSTAPASSTRRCSRDLPAPGRLRRRPRLPDPLLDAVQRPRGDAPHRAAQHAPGPPRLPTHRPADAPPDRRGRRPPRARRGHAVRRLQRGGLGRLESERRADDGRGRRRRGTPPVLWRMPQATLDSAPGGA